jgi:hypothetical protein
MSITFSLMHDGISFDKILSLRGLFWDENELKITTGITRCTAWAHLGNKVPAIRVHNITQHYIHNINVARNGGRHIECPPLVDITEWIALKLKILRHWHEKLDLRKHKLFHNRPSSFCSRYPNVCDRTKTMGYSLGISGNVDTRRTIRHIYNGWSTDSTWNMSVARIRL